MLDREVAARLARLRNANAELERRLRSDPGLPDSERYWPSQIDGWRQQLEASLHGYPFQHRAFVGQRPARREQSQRLDG